MYNDPNVKMEAAVHGGDVPVIKDTNPRYPAVSNNIEFRSVGIHRSEGQNHRRVLAPCI